MPQTVYVIGAGASYEMGLPVGHQLKKDISTRLGYSFHDEQFLSGDRVILDAMKLAMKSNMVPSQAGVAQTAIEIANALPLVLSIDNFLHLHNDDPVVEMFGKLAIAKTILAAERKSILFAEDDNSFIDFKRCENAWLIRFIQLLTEDCSLDKLEERLGTITFIVFNYDRCVEHFLIDAFIAIYRIPVQEAADLVRKIAIFHPYGTVGALPWMRDAEAKIIEYGGNPSSSKLLDVALGIKTFTEGTDDDSSDIIAIRRSVELASRIVFLGFAYHPLNMQLLLGLGVTSGNPRKVYGTAFGMSASDTASVEEMLRSSLFASSAATSPRTCFDLFHEYSRTLGFANP